MNKNKRTVKFTVADRLLATGQKLRADETATSTTFALTFAAKWHQATRNGR